MTPGERHTQTLLQLWHALDRAVTYGHVYIPAGQAHNIRDAITALDNAAWTALTGEQDATA